MRRRLVIALHWTTFFGLAALLASGAGAPVWLIWVFALAGLAWFASYVALRGPKARPGPKLTGWTIPAHRWQHHALYWSLPVIAFFSLTAFQSETTGRALKILLFASLLHGLFHLWRHMALYDGALKLMTPSVIHRHL